MEKLTIGFGRGDITPEGYVTPRWRWIALLMRCLPRGIFERIPLK